MLVAAAGPLMNLALAAVACIAAGLWTWACETGRIGPQPHVQENVTTFLFVGGFLNVYLCTFNLLPAPPLDGSAILAGLSRTLDRFFSQPGVQMYGMLVVLFLFYSSLRKPFGAFAVLTSAAITGGTQAVLERLFG